MLNGQNLIFTVDIYFSAFKTFKTIDFVMKANLLSKPG